VVTETGERNGAEAAFSLKVHAHLRLNGVIRGVRPGTREVAKPPSLWKILRKMVAIASHLIGTVTGPGLVLDADCKWGYRANLDQNVDTTFLSCHVAQCAI